MTFSAVAAVRPDAVLRFSGDDAQTWLGGQTTNDLTPLFEGKVDAVYTLFVTAKGRILADAWVSKDPDGTFVASLPAIATEALLEHFERYIIMEDVEVERLPLSVVSVVDGETPSDLLSNHHHQARDLGGPATRLFVPTNQLKPVVDVLRNSSLDILDADDWTAAKVATGEPRFGVDFSTEHYPQEAGLGSTAVSFNKGCYIGQEVVCMLENRGKFRRQLVHMTLAEPIESGADILLGDEVVGTVTSGATWEGAHFAIGMVARKALEQPDTLSVAGQGPLSLQPVGQGK